MTAAERRRELTRHEDRPGRECYLSTVIGPRGVRHCATDWALVGALARAVIHGEAGR